MGVFSRSAEMKSPLVLLISLSIGLGQDTKFVKTPSNGQNQNTKLFGFTDPNLGNSLVPGALGFGAGLLASNLIGGISGGSSGGGGCCCGRKKRQAESPDQRFLNLEGGGGRATTRSSSGAASSVAIAPAVGEGATGLPRGGALATTDLPLGAAVAVGAPP